MTKQLPLKEEEPLTEDERMAILEKKEE